MKYLIIDLETIPDGGLLCATKYKHLKGLSPEAAVSMAASDALQASNGKFDFINLAFHKIVTAVVMEVDDDYTIEDVAVLPAGRPEPDVREQKAIQQLVPIIGSYVERNSNGMLVTYNGRGFDLPMVEFAAYRHGWPMPAYYDRNGPRNRFSQTHLDLADWFSNYGACHPAGGLDLMHQVIGGTGKGEISGRDVPRMVAAGEFWQVNQYCIDDVLKTYHVFLRQQVLVGALHMDRCSRLTQDAITFREILRVGTH